MMEEVKKEFKKIAIIFAVVYLFFQLHYSKENPFTVFRLVLAHFYLFILPGYFLLLAYIKKIKFEYRLFIGAGLGYALQSYLGFFITLVFHINMKAYYLITPLVIIAVGMYLSRKEIKWTD